MPQYYEYGAHPRKYNAKARAVPYISRGGESRSLGSLGGYGSLGKLNVYGYGGGQDLGASNFGGQNKDLGLGASILSNNEKRLVMIGVIGLVGWFMCGDKIKKGFKSNPPPRKKKKKKTGAASFGTRGGFKWVGVVDGYATPYHTMEELNIRTSRKYPGKQVDIYRMDNGKFYKSIRKK